MNQIRFTDQLVPGRTLYGLEMYYRYGIDPGGFLTKVLTNDLFGAVDKADSENLKAIPALVSFIYNNLPRAAYGKSTRMIDWCNARKTDPIKPEED